MPVEQHTGKDIEEVLNELLAAAKAHKTSFGVPIPLVASQPIFAKGFAEAPDYGAANQVILCSYKIPRGYNAVICGLVFGYAGGGGTFSLPGQLLFAVDVDDPNAVTTGAQPGYTEKDYAAVPFQLGSLVGGPVWPVEFKLEQGEEIRVKGQTVSTVAVGPGNVLFAALVGFQWPSQGYEG